MSAKKRVRKWFKATDDQMTEVSDDATLESGIKVKLTTSFEFGYCFALERGALGVVNEERTAVKFSILPGKFSVTVPINAVAPYLALED